MIELREVDELTYNVFLTIELEKQMETNKIGDIQYHKKYGWIFFDYNTYEWLYDEDLKRLQEKIIDEYCEFLFE